MAGRFGSSIRTVDLRTRREPSGSRTIEFKARFRSSEESVSALTAARAHGFVAARCCSEDALEFELDFVQHPVATSIAAIIVCAAAGVVVGVVFDVLSPGASLWLSTRWAMPAVSALGGAALGASIALAICRSALHEYRDTRDMRVLAVQVRAYELDSLRALMRRHGAIELRIGAAREALAEPATSTRHAA